MSYGYSGVYPARRPPGDVRASIPANGVGYHMPFLSGDTIYSVDRLHIIFTPDAAFAEELRNDEFALCKYITYATTTGISDVSNQYHQAYNVRFGSSSMTIKLLRNSSLMPDQCSIDVNPNLCFGDKRCLEAIAFLLSRSIQFHIRIYDVAVDIPLPRHLFRMEKDRRIKTVICRSRSNATEYCGKRNHAGFCKLYDKTAESKLETSWTRIEITYGNPLGDDFSESLAKKLPIIKQKCADAARIMGTDERLSSTDRVLIAFFKKIKDPEFLAMQFKILDRKKQRRLKPYVYSDEMNIQFNLEAIRTVILDMINEILPSNYAVADNNFVNANYLQEETI